MSRSAWFPIASSWTCSTCLRRWEPSRQRCGCKLSPGTEPALRRIPSSTGAQLIYSREACHGWA